MKAVQSAMAIRRQRRRRDEALRAKARRSSHQSDHLMLSDSGDGSVMSLDTLHTRSARHRRMMGGVTTFHVGVVFILMGLMLLISGIVPGYSNRQHQYWEDRNQVSKTSSWNKESNGNSPLLMATGSFLILVGIVLVVANRIAVRKEDEQFSRYISRKLAPARMTHQPVSSIQGLHQHQKPSHKEDSKEEELHTLHDAPQCQSPGQQLESITEEAEGSERASKDQLYWTSDVAPVHSHQHHSAAAAKLHSGETNHDDQRPHKHHHHHHHGSSTG